MQSERGGIRQPPHSAGRSFRGRRALIDPAQTPSYISALWEEQRKWLRDPYLTCGPERIIPPATVDCTIVDQGNASSRFLRLSTYAIPHSYDLADTCAMPLGFHLQPFAQLQPGEADIPLVDFGEQGPSRCTKCGAYVNPWCTWTGGGQTWNCNLCHTPNEVPPEYFASLDLSGRRVDQKNRPELNCGTVDFVVTKEYHAPQPLPRLLPSFVPASGVPRRSTSSPPELRPPEPLRTLFIIDVSTSAHSNGLLSAVCQSIRQALYGPPPNDAPTPSDSEPFSSPISRQVGIMTFDRTLHFYNLATTVGQAEMKVVADIDDVFAPLSQGLFVDSIACREVIENLLNSLPSMFLRTVTPEVAFGAALRGGLATLARLGGQILAFQGSICTYGPGALTPRVESELYGSPKEKTLFTPQNIMWQNLAEECAESGLGVNIFLFPERYVDIATVGAVASVSGGDIYFHPRFDSARDSRVLQSEVTRVLSREVGYNCSVRVRASHGIHVSRYISLLHQPTPETLSAGTITADSSISATLTYDDTLDPRADAYFQSAVLYTSESGQRRIRISNLAVTVSQLAGNVFKYADFDTGVCLWAKQAILDMTARQLSEIRESYTAKYAKLLMEYRRNCAAATVPTQLILPESYKALPAIGLAVLKLQALKGGQVSSDIRSLHYHRVLSSMSPSTLMTYLYPRIVAVHDLTAQACFPDPRTGKLVLPAYMPASYIWMKPDGVYLLDNGFVTIMWIGGSVSPQILLDLFGVEDWDSLGPSTNHLPALESHLSVQVRNLISYEEARRGGRVVPFMIARQNLDASEIEFGNMLVEDENNDAMSYPEFLCQLHKDIGELMTKANTSWNPFAS